MKVIKKIFHVMSNIGLPMKRQLIVQSDSFCYVAVPFIYLFEDKFPAPVKEYCIVLGPVKSRCLFLNYQSTL